MVKALLLLGFTLLLLGGFLAVFPKAFAWFGHLPGDVRSENVFFPVTSMLIVSGVLTLLLNVLAWFFRSR